MNYSYLNIIQSLHYIILLGLVSVHVDEWPVLYVPSDGSNVVL